MLGPIVWLIIGALAGWIASLMLCREAQGDILRNLLTGMLGAGIGGLLAAHGRTGAPALSLGVFLVALTGGALLLSLRQLRRHRA